MTNAQAAAHFTSLPPNDEAKIDILDLDSGCVDTEPITLVDDGLLIQIDVDQHDRTAPGNLCVARKY